MFVSSEGCCPPTLIPPCFHLAIISATAYRNKIYAIASCNKLRDLAEVSYLVFLWSLILSDKKFMTPSCLRYLFSTCFRTKHSLDYFSKSLRTESRVQIFCILFLFYLNDDIHTQLLCFLLSRTSVFFASDLTTPCCMHCDWVHIPSIYITTSIATHPCSQFY